MAIAFVNVGAGATGTTTIDLPYHATVTAGNILLAHVVNKYPTNGPATPSGWTAAANCQASGGQGADTLDSGNVYSTVFYKVADGTETGNLTVSVPSGNTCSGAISQYSLAGGKTWSIAMAIGAMNTASTSWSVTAGSDPGITANDVLAMFSAHNSDAGALSAHSLSATSIVMGALTERTDSGNAGAGDDIRRWSAGGTVTSGTATAAPVYTATVSASGADSPAGCTVFVRLREVDSTTDAVGSSAGAATAAAVGASTAAASGTVAGAATAAATATSTAESAGTAAGTSTASGVTSSSALSITTFETVRDAQIAVIHALTPSIRADKKFIKHRDRADFMTWVETPANRKACWRRFQVAHNLDIEQGPTADGSIESCRHTEELRIAYPLDWGKYGAENERDLDDVIASDLHQIDAAIGLNGGESYVDGQHLCQKQAQAVLDLEGVRVLSITYLVQYDRSV